MVFLKENMSLLDWMPKIQGGSIGLNAKKPRGAQLDWMPKIQGGLYWIECLKISVWIDSRGALAPGTVSGFFGEIYSIDR